MSDDNENKIIRYEAEHRVDADVFSEFSKFMREHFLDVAKMGIFSTGTYEIEGLTVRLTWTTDRARFEKFQNVVAPPMREEVRRHFPHGIESVRRTFSVLEQWCETDNCSK